MEWDKKIPLGRQDLQDYWSWLNTPQLNKKSNRFHGVNCAVLRSLTPDKQASRLAGQAG